MNRARGWPNWRALRLAALVAMLHAFAPASQAQGLRPNVKPAGPQINVEDKDEFNKPGSKVWVLNFSFKELRRHDGTITTVDLNPEDGVYDCVGPPNNFIDLITGSTADNLAPGETAMRSVVLLDAAYRSAGSGKPEQVW